MADLPHITARRAPIAVLASSGALAAPLLLGAGAVAPHAAHASASQATIFEAPAELLDDSRRDRTLDEIAAFGVRKVRQLVYWEQFAPAPDSRRKPDFDATDPDAYPPGTWDRLDKLVAAARERGIAPFLTLTGPVPKWATKSKRDNLTRPSPREFGRWVTAVARRYGEHVNTWSIWNEPNQPQFLKPQYRKGRAYSPRLYRALYRYAYKALRRTSTTRRDKILIGETSPAGNSRVVSPIDFVRGTFCLSKRYKRRKGCGRLRASGYAHHAYTKPKSPFFRDPRRENVNIGSLSRLTRALARARRARAVGSLPLYLTEFGFQSHPDRISGVSLSKQAEYNAISEWIAYRNRRVRAFSQYLMRDDRPDLEAPESQRYPGFESGLRHHDGRAKPAYDAFRTPLVALRSGKRRVMFWGRVRPMPQKGPIVIQRRRGKGDWRDYKKLTTNSRGVFDSKGRYRRSYRYRVKWEPAFGGTFYGPPVRTYKR